MTERAILPGGRIPAWLERLNRSPEQAGPKGEGFRPGGVLSSPVIVVGPLTSAQWDEMDRFDMEES